MVGLLFIVLANPESAQQSEITLGMAWAMTVVLMADLLFAIWATFIAYKARKEIKN